MRLSVVSGLLAAAFALVGALAVVPAVEARRLERDAAAPSEESRYVAVRGGRLHVVILEPPAGGSSGKTLLLLHGASGNLRDLQESIGRRLSQRHRVVLIDRPGHGFSDRLGGREMASPALQGNAIAEALDALGIGRVVVVGHSWSGSLATNLALDHPAHVSGLVLLSPATHPWIGGDAWYNTAAAAPVLGQVFVAAVAGPVGYLTFDTALESVFRPHQPPPDYVRRTNARLLLRPAEFQANAQDLTDLKPFLARQSQRYGAIRVPTTIITADKDTIVSPDVHARPIHRQIRGSKLVVIKDGGHMTHWTATDRVIREIDAVAAKAR
ncbi:alpha/beta fold hydrolase [Hansschlegelia plantiphila]|uniref:Alpha/beta hydrolase n=1 Tax=Hansschlegelia plantiphila TaxID=374655 RepID=A0A9W6J0E1_9HYPH|nr:alpha/beta hydrolase [Hansschlegelia plantiphila]GLK68417.1 alpha/beta hydrolase [Hansschlegelia plantiphila]